MSARKSRNSCPFEGQLLETATDVESFTRGRPASIETKLDGWRGIAEVGENGSTTLWNPRGGANLTHHLPSIIDELEQRFPPGTWLDGEFCTADDRFGKVQSVLGCNWETGRERESVIRYAVFDVLKYADNPPIFKATYAERRSFLERCFDARAAFKGGYEPLVRIVPRFEATQEAYERMVAEGFEGGVVKIHDSIYSPGARGRGWGRLKNAPTMDVVAMGFIAGEGERGQKRGLGAIIFGQIDPKTNELRERGRCGGGFTDDEALRIWNAQEDHVNMCFQMRYFGFVGESEEPAPRSPQFMHWRLDKNPEDCDWRTS